MNSFNNDDTGKITIVVNCKKEDYDIYIGAPTKWANPFSTSIHTREIYKANSNEEAIKKYREWITTGDGKHLLNYLHELKGKTLGCYYKPLSCHGDVLSELINNI